MGRFEDIRDLFAVEGFEPDTWQRPEGRIEVSGTVLSGSDARHKMLVVARLANPTGPGGLVFGTGWVRPRPLPDREEEFSRVRRSVLERIAGRESEIRRWLLLRGDARDSVSREFPREKIAHPVPAGLIQRVADPATRDVRLSIGLHASCLQQCRFCPPDTRTTAGPPEWESDLAFVQRLADQVLRPARLRGIPVTVTLKADDLLGHGRLPQILEIIHAEAGCPIHLVTPVNRIRDASDARRVARLPGVESVASTLFAASAAVHDEVAGRPGAFRETVRAIRWLTRVGLIKARLRFVVTRQGLSDLPAVMDAASVLRASLTIAGLVADTHHHEWCLAGLMPRNDHVRRVLEERVAVIVASGAEGREPGGRGWDEPIEIVDLPLCALPPPLRKQARSRRSRDRVLVGYGTAKTCLRCRGRSKCLGVPRPYLEDFGEVGIEPI